MYKLFLFIVSLFVLTADEARAEETSCKAHFRFRWGEEVSGSLATRAGTPCRVLMSTRGNLIMLGTQVVRAPRNGTAASIGPASVRYQPRAGFTGQDFMSVRYSGKGTGGRDGQAIVNFTITVY